MRNLEDGILAGLGTFAFLCALAVGCDRPGAIGPATAESAKPESQGPRLEPEPGSAREIEFVRLAAMLQDVPDELDRLRLELSEISASNRRELTLEIQEIEQIYQQLLLHQENASRPSELNEAGIANLRTLMDDIDRALDRAEFVLREDDA